MIITTMLVILTTGIALIRILIGIMIATMLELLLMIGRLPAAGRGGAGAGRRAGLDRGVTNVDTSMIPTITINTIHTISTMNTMNTINLYY